MCCRIGQDCGINNRIWGGSIVAVGRCSGSAESAVQLHCPFVEVTCEPCETDPNYLRLFVFHRAMYGVVHCEYSAEPEYKVLYTPCSILLSIPSIWTAMALSSIGAEYMDSQ